MLKDELLKLVDEDTLAFNRIMESFALAKSTEEEKKIRSRAIQDATKYAIEIPLRVMQCSFDAFDVIEAMVKTGNPNSVTDAGVGALAVRSAVVGAYLNVIVNTGGLNDQGLKDTYVQQAAAIREKAMLKELEILKLVEGAIQQ